MAIVLIALITFSTILIIFNITMVLRVTTLQECWHKKVGGNLVAIQKHMDGAQSSLDNWSSEMKSDRKKREITNFKYFF